MNVCSNSVRALKIESVTLTRVIGSIVPVGSSKTMILGSLINTCAKATLCFSPTLNWSGYLSKITVASFSPNPTVVNA